MRWGIYLRISLDRGGKRAGVERQRADALAIVEREDPTADVVEFEDNDVSAWSGVARPAYARMLAGVAAGQLDKIAAYHSDRLWRSVADQQAFLMVARDGGLKEVLTPGQRFDPADADDEFASTIMVAVAQKESANTSRRMKRAQAAKAERGEFHGGPRAFGHSTDRTALVDDEAELIHEAARRVLRGESMRSVVMDWNGRGLKSTRGVPWRVDSMRDLLRQPRLAGLREHHGQLYEAAWPPILDRVTWQRLTVMFEARKRGPNGSTRSARKNLLSGMLRCHKCGQRLVGTGDRYRCSAPGSGGCSGATVRIVHADAAVRDQILDYLDSPAFAKALDRAQRAAAKSDAGISKALDQLAKDRAQLTELGDAFADGTLSRTEYKRLTDRVRARIAENEAMASKFDAAAAAPGVGALADQGAKLREAWGAMTLQERRDVLRALVDHVVVLPAPPPVNRFNPDRLDVRWRF